MTTLFRLIAFEFNLIRILFFRLIFERLTNTVMAAFAGLMAVYAYAYLQDEAGLAFSRGLSFMQVQSMVLFALLYGETIMANWQYMINKTGRMELIFNSTQPPLKIIFAKNFTSALITLASMVLIYIIPAAWFGLLGAFGLTFWIVAVPTLLVCCSIMCFNAMFEFKLKQVKALTATINLVLPFMAIQFAKTLPPTFDLIPYFSTARFLDKADRFTASDVAWLYGASAITAGLFLVLTQLLVRRIRSTASVYLD